MNKETVEKILNDFMELNDGKGANASPDELYYCLEFKAQKQLDQFNIKLEQQFGGEGQGDQYWMILSIFNKESKETTYIKFDGWYSSQCGHEWHGNDFSFVVPAKVQVIEWVEV